MTLANARRCARCGRWQYDAWTPTPNRDKPPQSCVCDLLPLGGLYAVAGYPVNLVEERA